MEAIHEIVRDEPFPTQSTPESFRLYLRQVLIEADVVAAPICAAAERVIDEIG